MIIYKSRRNITKIMIIDVLLLLSLVTLTYGKILSECEAMKELQRGGISRSFISNWICLMKNESGMDTQLITGPKAASNYYYGIFQISSGKWCTRGRVGGICNKRCEDFANDDIQDDIICAKTISNMDGFKAWNEWTKKCKNKPLPNIRHCTRRRSIT
ncbi:PREDICTED: lysozyme c-1-like [Polistes canadensis]|uniref:lysozyme c-1-like n=1 Tax=Polistes canadensis TaxID=91411 RepID=UPI000718D1AD|nr:PREDICTED: lysozyme c-1-like [Polistes canadensis]